MTQYALKTPLGQFNVSETEDAPRKKKKNPYIAIAPEKLLIPARGN